MAAQLVMETQQVHSVHTYLEASVELCRSGAARVYFSGAEPDIVVQTFGGRAKKENAAAHRNT